MTFKELLNGDIFEFDHEGVAFHRDLAHGPWVKRSHRTYVYADNRSVQHFRVGTSKAKVKLGDDCGGEVR